MGAPGPLPRIDIEVASALLPYRDLKFHGDPERYLRFGRDIFFTFSGLIALNNGEPRMVQANESGALLVAPVDDGVNNALVYAYDIASGDTGPEQVAPAGCGSIFVNSFDGNAKLHIVPLPGVDEQVISFPNVAQVNLPINVLTIKVEATAEGGASGEIVMFFRTPIITQQPGG